MANQEFPTYKGKPIVRCGDELYLGSIEEPYVIVNGLEVADKVLVQLLATDPSLSPRKQLIKTSEKNGMFLALDIADIWLERALANKI